MRKAILLKPLDGDPEGAEREFSNTDFKELLALGAIRAADDDEVSGEPSALALAQQTETLDQLRERHQAELNRAAEHNAKLTDQVRDTCMRAENAEAELAQLREAGAGASAAAAAASARIADLEAQLAAARAVTQEGSEKAAQDPENKMQADPANKVAPRSASPRTRLTDG